MGLAALALPLLALPAAAQERPLFIPQRDVAVTYRVTSGEAAGRELRMAWLAGPGKLRIDAPGAPGWSVVDQKAKRMLVVMDQQRAFLEVPSQGGPGGFALPDEPAAQARFTRGGSATIAGHRCTLWRYEEGQARGEACLTEDGVMLRSSGAQGRHSGAVEAVAVEYGPQDPARFAPPAGYRSMQLPDGLALPGGKPPGR
ncbi:DUF4412 domain-containing protein [Roseicella aquatilis]|uniref:DUF4412 domain-containing protein n=1 Tax=Roseicella aquatilis TaxID=2527868 RepID=A0A4R4D5M2_9PROT|nr:DUF4412 domain-containing protein [Roseicella aquatilis]TCZ55273.1 DUF4412 domain-containing protein [Roseicella aquatilis]